MVLTNVTVFIQSIILFVYTVDDVKKIRSFFIDGIHS
jgi:hypothetical protein